MKFQCSDYCKQFLSIFSDCLYLFYPCYQSLHAFVPQQSCQFVRLFLCGRKCLNLLFPCFCSICLSPGLGTQQLIFAWFLIVLPTYIAEHLTKFISAQRCRRVAGKILSNQFGQSSLWKVALAQIKLLACELHAFCANASGGDCVQGDCHLVGNNLLKSWSSSLS